MSTEKTCDELIQEIDKLRAQLTESERLLRVVREGEVDTLSTSIQDVKECKRAEEALRESEQRFRLTLQAAQMGWWHWDLTKNVLTADAQTKALFGLPINAEISYELFLTLLVPEDFSAIEQKLAEAIGGPGDRELDFRIRKADGSIHWLAAKGRAIHDDRGTSLCLMGVVSDITERKLVEEALQKAKIAAETANDAKGRFLANISHELRTPMNAILGMIDLALPKQADATAKDCLQTARESADLLLTLLNDLLDSAKIEAGKLELELAPFSLRKVLDQTTQVLAVRAREKGIAFCCRIPTEVPDALVGDQVRLRQVLLNLAGNGIKFTEHGGVTVSVRLESRTDEKICLEFAVQDTGVGIANCDRDRIFRPFAQAEPSTLRRFGGTGLGLTISSSLVSMMGGRMWVESDPGQGSTFYFTVRLTIATQPPPELYAPDELTVATAKLRILLVEDNPANQKLAAYILQERGHTVDVTSNGRQAISMVQDNCYDVILMDVQMPDMDGLEATQAIRAREKSQKRVPIIAMTAYAMKGDRELCLASGMDGYLSKPIDAQKMMVLVESLAAGVQSTSASIDSQSSVPGKPERLANTLVFDRESALKQCFNNPDMLHDMIQCFLDDVDNVFSQMHIAMQKSDWVELGRIGHRLKGTILYLGAKPAKEAVERVENFQWHCTDQAEAKNAVTALERQCANLKAALAEHPNTA